MIPISVNPNDLRQVQLKELEILIELDRVCKKLGIDYFLFFGTLIGAIRHGGFIPWDDDIDVVMFRGDYERFIREASKELITPYFLQTNDSDPEFPAAFAKLRNSETTFVENEFRNRQMNHGIYIDIFPLNGIPSNKIIRSIVWYPIKITGFLAGVTSGCILPKNKIERGIKHFVDLIHLHENTLFKINSFLLNIINPDHSRFVVHSARSTYSLDLIVYERAWFDDKVMIYFEGHEFPIPAKFDPILKHIYGNYWILPSPEQRMPHHNAIKISVSDPYYTDVPSIK